MKKIIGIFALSALLFACDTTDETSLSGRTDTVYFDDSEATLDITNLDPGTVSFDVLVSKSASNARTLTLDVDASSTAIASTYAIDAATLTIPANSITGTVTVNGVYDASIPSTGTENLILNLDGDLGLQSANPGIGATNKQFNITINRSCVNPANVPADYFVGDYTLANISAFIGPAVGDVNFEEVTVTLTVNGANPNLRDFTTTILPTWSADNGVVANIDVTASIEFTALSGVVLTDIGTNIGCGSEIVFKTAGADNSAWIVCDDDTITVNYTEDDNTDCGGPFLGSAFSLTKI